MAFELDKHIASLLAKKDTKAINLLYENYSNSLFGVIKSIIDNDKIAEDAFSKRHLLKFGKMQKNSTQIKLNYIRGFTELQKIQPLIR